ncbi:MAG: CHASE domain-containing protein, partial [Pseudobdellovibrionaceae bacterium]
MESPIPQSQKKNYLRYLLFSSLFALIYLTLGKFGLTLATFHVSASPVWPASGFAVAILGIFGLHYFPAIFIGAFFTNFFIATPALTSLGIATGNTVEALAGAWIVLYFLDQFKGFPEYKGVFAFTIGSTFSAFLSAGIGAFTLNYSGKVDVSSFVTVFTTWWTGDVLGILVFSPFLFSLVRDREEFHKTLRTRLVPFCLLIAFVILISCWVFFVKQKIVAAYIIYPMLLVPAAFLGRTEIRIMTLIVALVSILGTYQGLGPFHHSTLNENLVWLQHFLASIALTSLASTSFRAMGPLRYPALTMLFLWAVTAAVSWHFEKSELAVDKERFIKIVDTSHNSITNRMKIYEDALRGGAGLFAASDFVERSEWKAYVDALRIHERYPGILGMGYIEPVNKKNLNAFISKQKQTGSPNFNPHFVHNSEKTIDAEEFYLIKYIEPQKGNMEAIGLDVSSENHRKIAADLAKDSGQPAITSRITLVQDKKMRPGFLLYVPVYLKNTRTHTLESRRANFIGWIYAPFITESFLKNSIVDQASEVDFTVFEKDGDSNEAKVLFSTTEKVPSSFSRKTPLILGQKAFVIGWTPSSRFVSSYDVIGAWIAVCGTLIALLAAGLVAALQSINRKAEDLAGEKTALLLEKEQNTRKLNIELEKRVAARTHDLEIANNLLSQSEKQFRDLADSMPQIIWTATPDGKFDYFNERWYEYTGLNINSELTKESEIVLPGDYELSMSAWNRSIQTGNPFEK